MKAERRHELKENSLVRGVETFPNFAKKYGNQILLGIIAALLIIILVRYRMSSSGDQSSVAADNLANAEALVQQLKGISGEIDRYPPDRFASARQEIVSNTESALSAATRAAGDKDTTMRAAILVVQGDLYWTLANMPEIPGAATQPLLKMDQTPDDLLKASETAYQKVVDQYPMEALSVCAARFGLAAIAENRSDWDKANQAYQAIIDDKNAADSFKFQAQLRQQQLAQLKLPVYIGTPSTEPAITSPETSAFTPTTTVSPGVSVIPSTMPSTTPVTTPVTTPATMPSIIPPVVPSTTTSPATMP